MFTTFDILDNIYDVLHDANYENIFKISKPVNTILDSYIVINTLDITPDILQQCHVNVNYHVRDIDKTKRIANYETLQLGANALITTLDDYNDGDIDISISFQRIMMEDDLPEHYVNIRLIVRHVQ